MKVLIERTIQQSAVVEVEAANDKEAEELALHHQKEIEFDEEVDVSVVVQCPPELLNASR